MQTLAGVMDQRGETALAIEDAVLELDTAGFKQEPKAWRSSRRSRRAAQSIRIVRETSGCAYSSTP